MDRDVKDDGVSSGTDVKIHVGKWEKDEWAVERRDEKTFAPLLIEEASKWDTDKIKYSLVPVEALRRLAALYTLGAERHGERNWEKGTDYSRWYDALQRHANAWQEGEEYDPADGQHHMIAVAWNAFALFEYVMREIGNDDRPKI